MSLSQVAPSAYARPTIPQYAPPAGDAAIIPFSSLAAFGEWSSTLARSGTYTALQKAGRSLSWLFRATKFIQEQEEHINKLEERIAQLSGVITTREGQIDYYRRTIRQQLPGLSPEQLQQLPTINPLDYLPQLPVLVRPTTASSGDTFALREQRKWELVMEYDDMEEDEVSPDDDSMDLHVVGQMRTVWLANKLRQDKPHDVVGPHK